MIAHYHGQTWNAAELIELEDTYEYTEWPEISSFLPLCEKEPKPFFLIIRTVLVLY
jgi:hypothetical protein